MNSAIERFVCCDTQIKRTVFILCVSRSSYKKCCLFSEFSAVLLLFILVKCKTFLRWMWNGSLSCGHCQYCFCLVDYDSKKYWVLKVISSDSSQALFGHQNHNPLMDYHWVQSVSQQNNCCDSVDKSCLFFLSILSVYDMLQLQVDYLWSSTRFNRKFIHFLRSILKLYEIIL